MLLGSLFSSIVLCAGPQGSPDGEGLPALDALLGTAPPPVRKIVDAAEEYRVQIAFGRIEPRAAGRPRLVRETHGDLQKYFYPASTVKLCAAVAALSELNAVNAERGTCFGVDARLEIGAPFQGDVVQREDPQARDGALTVGGQIRELFLVSDNVAYNRLYELCGPDGIHRHLHAGGFGSLRIHHRLSEFHGREDQYRLRPVTITDRDGARLELSTREVPLAYDNSDLEGIEAGRAHFAGGVRVDRPLSFRFKNAVRLVELQDMLVELVRPDLDTGVARAGFDRLTTEQRRFLRVAMGQLPRESVEPRYDPAQYPDDYVKFVLPGVRRVLPADRIRIYSKVGRAYGFSTENAYVEDLATGRGFFVAAVVYTNPNGILNDDDYAYEELADPFFAGLGELLARSVFGG